MEPKQEIAGQGRLYVGYMAFHDLQNPPQFPRDEGGNITLPEGMSFAILDEADASDPLNQLRVFCVRFGDEIAYRVTLTQFASEKDCLKIAFMAMLMIGVEHHAEISSAIERLRDE